MFGAVIWEGGWPAKAHGDACMEGVRALHRGQLFGGAPTGTWDSKDIRLERGHGDWVRVWVSILCVVHFLPGALPGSRAS